MNFVEFPLGTLADRVVPDTKSLVYTDRIPHPKTRESVERRLEITPSAKHGLPTAVDDEVILGLIQLTKRDNNFTSPTVTFSRYELIRMMRWHDDGWSYHRLDESLNRWIGVTLYYDNAWWDSEKENWVDEKFHVLDHVSLHRGKRGRSTLTWNRDVVFPSFQTPNMKALDLDFYFSLQHTGSRRAFRFLDKRFHVRPRWEFDLREFACERLGMSRNYHTGQIKQRLRPFLEELEGNEFLRRLRKEERYVKIRRGVWRIVLSSGVPKRTSKSALAAAQASLLAQLAKRGVTPKTADRLVRSYSQQRVKRQLEVFDWLARKGDRKGAGFLVKSIEDNYSTPDGFESSGQREARRRRESERRREEQLRKQQDEDRAKHSQAEREQLRATWQPIWDGLSEQQRDQIRDAVVGANTVLRKLLARKPHLLLDRCLEELSRRRESKDPPSDAPVTKM